MKIKKYAKFLAFLTLALQVSHASASSYSGKIDEILMGLPYGNNVIIKVDGSPKQSGCHTNPNFHYVFDGSTDLGKMTLSAVFIAHSTQKEVTFYGAGDASCDLFGGIEDLQQFLLK